MVNIIGFVGKDINQKVFYKYLCMKKENKFPQFFLLTKYKIFCILYLEFFWGKADNIYLIKIKVTLHYHRDRHIISLTYKAVPCFSETMIFLPWSSPECVVYISLLSLLHYPCCVESFLMEKQVKSIGSGLKLPGFEFQRNYTELYDL